MQTNTISLFPLPAYHRLLQAGGAPFVFVMRAALGTFFLGERVQLPQVEHGLDHQLQGTHSMGPASPRTFGGVRSGRAAASVLDNKNRR